MWIHAHEDIAHDTYHDVVISAYNHPYFKIQLGLGIQMYAHERFINCEMYMFNRNMCVDIPTINTRGFLESFRMMLIDGGSQRPRKRHHNQPTLIPYTDTCNRSITGSHPTSSNTFRCYPLRICTTSRRPYQYTLTWIN